MIQVNARLEGDFSEILWTGSSYLATNEQGIVRSSDGLNWTIIKSGAAFSQLGLDELGTLLAIKEGRTGSDVWLSDDDGLTWTLAKESLQSETADLAYGNGLWVAVGENGIIRRSGLV